MFIELFVFCLDFWKVKFVILFFYVIMKMDFLIGSVFYGMSFCLIFIYLIFKKLLILFLRNIKFYIIFKV